MAYPLIIDNTSRRVRQLGRSAKLGSTALTAAMRWPLLLKAQPKL